MSRSVDSCAAWICAEIDAKFESVIFQHRAKVKAVFLPDYRDTLTVHIDSLIV